MPKNRNFFFGISRFAFGFVLSVVALLLLVFGVLLYAATFTCLDTPAVCKLAEMQKNAISLTLLVGGVGLVYLVDRYFDGP